MFNKTKEAKVSLNKDNECVSELIKPIVYIVDDDRSVRIAIERLLISAGMETCSFESADEFLESGFRDQGACLVADVYMKGRTGFNLTKEIKTQGKRMPVILITGFGTTMGRVKAKRLGAAEYLSKPFDDQTLLDTIHWAMNMQK